MKTTSKVDAGRSTAREEPEAEREMVVSRRIGVPREVVFEAFTSAERLARWWGPDGFRTTTSRFELRPGGKWIFVMHGPDGTDYPNQITWKEIVPPERLVYLHGSVEGDPEGFDARITFVERGAETEVTLRAVFPTRARLELVREKYHAEEGGKQTLGRLAALVERAGASQGA